MGSIFSAFRLKKTTVDKLQTLKRAFELTKSQPLSNDYFVEMVMDCVKEQEPKVWETYNELRDLEDRASGNKEE